MDAMRISTQQFFTQRLSSVSALNANLQRLTDQISSGKQLLGPADNPQAFANVLDIGQQQSVVAQYQSNGTLVTNRLSLEATALTTATNVLNQVRTLAVSANNPTVNAQDRRTIATQVQGALQAIVDAANTHDANGEAIFGGYQRLSQPFSLSANGTVSYNGDQGVRTLQVGSMLSVQDSDPGFAVFMAGLNGNGTFQANSAATNTGTGSITVGSVLAPQSVLPDTYQIVFSNPSVSPQTFSATDLTTGLPVNDSTTGSPLTNVSYTPEANIQFNGISVAISGTPATGDTFQIAPSSNQSVFATLNKLVTALQSNAGTSQGQAKFQEQIGQVLSELTLGMDRIDTYNSATGARLQGLSTQAQANSGIQIDLTTSQSSLQDTDVASSASHLELDKTALTAAYQAFSMVQGLSLFNFVRL